MNSAWVELTDEDRQRAFNSLPDMLDGFLKTWGWLHFAKAIEAECRQKNAEGKADLLEAATFILRGIEGGHVKCAPYFDFDPDAEQIEFKHPADMLRAAIAKAGGAT
jgi:hypothetical protein